MDRLLSMRAFQTVVDEGGFAAAARALDMAPAGITRLVGDLESHLGTRLLQRTTRHFALTEAGEAYLAKLRLILGDIDEAHAEVQATSLDMAGVLHISAPPVLAVHVLAPALVGFANLHPKVLIDIHVDYGDTHAVEDFDLTLIGSNRQLDGNFIARPVVTGQGFLCASPGYLARRGTPQAPEDLAHHACLRIKLPGNQSRKWRLLNTAEGDREIEVDVMPSLIANHTDTLMRATLEGAGISSYPTDLLEPYLVNGQLQRVLSPWITGYLTVYAAMPSRKYIPKRTRVFLDYLIERTRAAVGQ